MPDFLNKDLNDNLLGFLSDVVNLYVSPEQKCDKIENNQVPYTIDYAKLQCNLGDMYHKQVEANKLAYIVDNMHNALVKMVQALALTQGQIPPVPSEIRACILDHKNPLGNNLLDNDSIKFINKFVDLSKRSAELNALPKSFHDIRTYLQNLQTEYYKFKEIINAEYSNIR
jgi:hypothetical protein